MLAFVLALGILTWIAQGIIDHQYNPNVKAIGEVTERYSELVLESNRYDHYVAVAQINGRDFDVLIDTGATQLSISAQAARELGLEFGPQVWVSTANGNTTAFRTTIDSFSLGPIELKGLRATIVNNMSDPDVLVGMNVLRDLEMTHRDGRLILRQYN